MVKLSVIIPVFNAERYIDKCLNSILQQTFSDFEVLIINDGSKDNTLPVIQEYAAKDSRIHVFDQQNKGVSAARNLGLTKARGDFISMIDADDFIDSEMFKIMLESIEKNNADLAICGMNYYSDQYLFQYSGYKCNKLYTSDELLNSLWEKPNLLAGSCANKIFRNKNLVRFDESLKVCEDILFLLDNYPRFTIGVQVDSCLYNVVINQASATRKNEYDVAYKIILASNYIQNHARMYTKDIQAGAIDKFLDDAVRYSKIMQRSQYEKSKNTLKKLIIKQKMLASILYAVNHRLLNSPTIRGYFFEMLRL